MERLLTFAEAIREGTEQEMERDPAVIVFGMGVDDKHLMYGTTRGLVDRFGRDRVFDTPLSEEGMTGAAIGMALAGLRPIHVHIRMDFVLLAMNQIINMAAKMHYMYGGKVHVPIVIRSMIGRSWGQGPQHSQGLHSLFMHVPGLKVVAPATPYDAKGIMIESIRDNNPVMYVEHRFLHSHRSHVPPEPYSVPFGQGRRIAEGRHVTLVGISHMAVECLRARALLLEQGVEAEVIDPVSLVPLDLGLIAESAAKTGRLLVVDSAWLTCGASAEILTQVVERLQGKCALKIDRMGHAHVTCPTTRNLENLYYPNAQTIAARAFSMVETNGRKWVPKETPVPEVIEFRGPF